MGRHNPHGHEPIPISVESIIFTFRVPASYTSADIEANGFLPTGSTSADTFQLAFNLYSDDHTQGVGQQLTNWALAVEEMEKRFPWLRTVNLQSDGAGCYNTPACSAWFAKPAGELKVGWYVHNEPGHGADVCDSNGAVLSQRLHSAGKLKEGKDFTAAQVREMAMDCGVKGQVHRVVKHDPSAKLDSVEPFELQSRDVLAIKFDHVQGGARLFNFFEIGEGVKVSKEDIDARAGGKVLPKVSFEGGGLLNEADEVAVLTSGIDDAKGKEKMRKGEEKLQTRIELAVEATAGTEENVMMTKTEVLATMLQAVVAKNVDVSRLAREPVKEVRGKSIVTAEFVETNEEAALCGISANNSRWEEVQNGDGASEMRRVPSPPSRQGCCLRDRTKELKSGLIPLTGYSAEQIKWLEENVELRLNELNDAVVHKHYGKYMSASKVMQDKLGIEKYLGPSQIQRWVEKKRKAYWGTEAGKEAAEGLAKKKKSKSARKRKAREVSGVGGEAEEGGESQSQTQSGPEA